MINEFRERFRKLKEKKLENKDYNGKIRNKKMEAKEETDKKNKDNLKFLIVAIILITVFCIAITPVTFQNDTYYTIKIGEHISKCGIDMQDPFSWHENLSYTYPHWAYDLATYYIYDLFGFVGIYIVTCILSVILGLSIFGVNCKLIKNQPISFLLTIGTIYLIRAYIAARAQLVTFILFILTVFFIEKFLETKKKKYAISLIIIPIIIANIHVAVFPFYFILYLPYIAEYFLACFSENIVYRKASIRELKLKVKILSRKKGNDQKVENLKNELKQLEEKVEKIKIKRSKELQNPYKIKMTKNDNVKWLIIIMIICLFTGFLTPLGNTPYTYLVKTLQGNTTQNINEHLPMTIANETEVLCVLILFLAILIFTKAKIRLSDLFMIGGLCFLMLSSRRQITVFALVGVIILNRLIMQLINIYCDKEFLSKLQKSFSSVVGIIIIMACVLGLSYHFGKGKFDDKFVSKSTYPVDACDYIIENIDLGQARFYNEYNYGSYMLFRGIPVFIDSRADLYAPEFSGKKDDIFMDFIETSNISKYYEDIFEKYGITHVITYENSKMNMIITKSKDENYKELYKDDYFVVYERESN